MSGYKRKALFIAYFLTISTSQLMAQSGHMEHHHESGADPASPENLTTFFSKLWAADFMPHGHCYFWRPDIVWLHVISESIIALAYFAIPAVLLFFVWRKGNLPFRFMFIFFSSFIFLCGITHIFGIITLWEPIYRMEGIIKAITAGVSLATVILLFPLIPKALNLRSPEELERLNRQLIFENDEKFKTQKKLQELNFQLERIVDARTKKLKQKGVDLERSNNALEQFAYVASHDLQEPLRMIHSFLQLIQEEAGETLKEGNIPEYFHFALDGTKRMKQLIDDLLEFSRFEKVNGTVVEEINTDEIITLTLKNIQAEITETKAKVITKNLPKIWVNKISFVRLFQNLISNSIKYRKKDQPPEIFISCEDEGSHNWKFTVSDNGIGIDPKNWKRIFLLFQRLHSRTEYPGSGMGLAIAKKIVETHQGRIWVDSSLGNGTTFYFTIPQNHIEETDDNESV